MSYNIFFISDHHWGHAKPYDTFLRKDGRFLRYEFANADEADEEMIRRHNEVVKIQDRVYFVGDVCFHKKHLEKLGRMHGRKVLIKGNHDLLDTKDYLQYFDDIRGVHQFKGVLISHIPVHPESLARWGFNVHGHLHDKEVMKDIFHICRDDPPGYVETVADPRYFNVSVERINYTPISLEEVMKHKPKQEENEH
jgi:calcineurin-like phosphoesterase family protein